MANTNINVDLNACPTEYCECGCPFYRHRTIIKRIKGLMVGLPQDQYLNIDLLLCEGCGSLHSTSKAAYPNLELPKRKGKEVLPENSDIKGII